MKWWQIVEIGEVNRMGYWEAMLDEGFLHWDYNYDYDDGMNGLNFELCKAISLYDVDKVKQCLENGAGNVRILLYDGLWWSDFANNNKKLEIIRLLVKNGADVNVRDKQGCSVLAKAISVKSISILKFLVENGADIDDNLLFEKMNSWTDEMCKYLIQFKEVQNAFIRIATFYIKNAFMTQEKEMIHIINKCIRCGMDINITNNNGETALMFACQRGYLEVVLILVAGGANINAKDENGKTVLNYAAEGGNTEIVKLLLAQGADSGVKK